MEEWRVLVIKTMDGEEDRYKLDNNCRFETNADNKFLRVYKNNVKYNYVLNNIKLFYVIKENNLVDKGDMPSYEDYLDYCKKMDIN